jgi:hypothetical protein
MAPLHKLSTEGRLEETKMILGWMWGFWGLTISLSINKYTACLASISKTINNKETTLGSLDTTIWRLTHVSMIIPFVHHFLSRLQELLIHSKQINHCSIKITTICINNLKLMNKCYLVKARDKINMKKIAYQQSTYIYLSDLCPEGIGEYSNKGFVWCLPLGDNLKFCTSNNLLKHLTGIISPWVNILAGCLKPSNCSLSMTDSTTSEGWTWKTNFKEDVHEVQATIQIKVERAHASCFMTANIREYSQWLPGSKNQVANTLSHDWDWTNNDLTLILFTHVPLQVPNFFKIVPLPNMISSYMTSLLLRLPIQLQYNKENKITTLGCGSAGRNTASQQGLEMTTSINGSLGTYSPTCSVLLPWLCAKGNFCNQLMLPWLVRQSAVLSITWQRPSGVTGTQTHPTTNTVPLTEI